VKGHTEYTGVIPGRQRDSIRPHLYQQIDSAAERKSLIRSSAYITGPLYGYLLFQKAPQWMAGVDSDSSFRALISRYYHITPAKTPADAVLAAAMSQYHGTAIVRSEEAKEREHQKQVDQYVDLFTRKPVLRIELIKMNVSFNPNNLFDLGVYGTVYPNAEVKDNWGQLNVEQGGMLMKDWKVIYLSMTSDPLPNEKVITGKGWRMTLNKGWKIVKSDELHYRIIRGEQSLAFSTGFPYRLIISLNYPIKLFSKNVFPLLLRMKARSIQFIIISPLNLEI